MKPLLTARSGAASAQAPSPDRTADAKPLRWAAIPTALSASRFILAAAFPFTGRLTGLGLAALAAVSDGLDGYLARRWKVTTVTGSVLDALSDKVFLWAALGTFVARGHIPVWMLVLLLFRDAVAVPAALLALVTRNRDVLRELDHPHVSRFATLALFALVMSQLAAPSLHTLNHTVVGVAAALSIAAGVNYLAQLRRLAGGMHNQKSQHHEHERS